MSKAGGTPWRTRPIVSGGALMNGNYGIAMLLAVKVPMHAGVRLSADIYLPHGAPPAPQW